MVGVQGIGEQTDPALAEAHARLEGLCDLVRQQVAAAPAGLAGSRCCRTLAGAAHGAKAPSARMFSMKLTSHLPDDRRAHVEGRLRANLMAWLTTVRPDGRPDSVPVWFLLRDDETFLVYSQAAKVKLRNISHNPRVALGLDVTDIGRDIIRIDGTAEHVPGFPAADQVPEYLTRSPA